MNISKCHKIECFHFNCQYRSACPDWLAFDTVNKGRPMSLKYPDVQLARGVVANAEVMSGVACVSSRRISTKQIASRFAEGESPESIARDCDINLDSVYDAIRYEYRRYRSREPEYTAVRA